MLKLFEDITNDLTEYERLFVAPWISAGLRTKVGKANAIPASCIIAKVNKFIEQRGETYKLNGVRVRKLVGFLRLVYGGRLDLPYSETPFFIGSCSKGYFNAQPEEMEMVCESLRQRINQQSLILEALKVTQKQHAPKTTGPKLKQLTMEPTWQAPEAN